MVIINYKAGQLANRIWHFASFLANSIEYKYELINPSFDEYCEHFEFINRDDFDGYPITTRLTPSRTLDRFWNFSFRLHADITHKLFQTTPYYKLYRIFKSHDKKAIDFDLSDPDFVRNAQTRRVIVEGWCFRDPDSLSKHADHIRKWFTPLKRYQEEVKKVISDCESAGEVIVGVHIRRGDYARFKQGQWFYEDEVYSEKMRSVQEQLTAQGKSCVFLLCSNEPIEERNYQGLTIKTGNRHFMVDLYALAACDYIMGPPSTFTMWASFYGDAPLRQLETKKTSVELESFHVQLVKYP